LSKGKFVTIEPVNGYSVCNCSRNVEIRKTGIL